jgi:hypothetical protein
MKKKKKTKQTPRIPWKESNHCAAVFVVLDDSAVAAAAAAAAVDSDVAIMLLKKVAVGIAIALDEIHGRRMGDEYGCGKERRFLLLLLLIATVQQDAFIIVIVVVVVVVVHVHVIITWLLLHLSDSKKFLFKKKHSQKMKLPSKIIGVVCSLSLHYS